MIYITSAFILSILIAKIAQHLNPIIHITLSAMIALITISNVNRKQFFLSIILLIISVGAFYSSVRLIDDNPQIAFNQHRIEVVSCVETIPIQKANQKTFHITIRSINNSPINIKAQAKIMNCANQIFIGDQIIGKAIINTVIRENKYQYYVTLTKIIQHKSNNKINVLNLIQKVRLVLLKKTRKLLKPPYSEVLIALFMGDKVAELPEDINQSFKKTGVSHVLVASGMHLSILIGLINLILNKIMWSKKTIFIVSSGFILFYVVLCGGSNSILRAAFMTEMSMLAIWFNRQNDFLNNLFLAILVLLIINPENIYNVGFQLSISATWAVGYLANNISNIFRKHKMYNLISLIVLSSAPFVVTWPIIAYHFNQVSIITVFANLFILPIIAFVVSFGVILIIISFLIMPIAQIVAIFYYYMLFLLVQIITWMAKLSFSAYFIKSPNLIVIFIYYVLVIIFSIQINNRDLKLSKILIVTIISIFIMATFVSARASNDLSVSIIDVGQGDAILINYHNQKRILIDGGERWAGKKRVIPYLKEKGINELDWMVLTHPHEDHVGGLIPILEEIETKHVLDGGEIYNSQSYQRFLALINQNKIKYYLAKDVTAIKLGSDCILSIYCPGFNMMQKTNSNINNNSIIIKINYKDQNILLMGDLEMEGEKALISMGFDLNSQIIKIGHHGSKTATSDELLNQVNPRMAFISCGQNNKFKHPHLQTINKLINNDIHTYRTDNNGTIEINYSDYKAFINLQKE